MFERLKEIRAYENLNQAEFAKSLGIGQSTLAMLEVGKRDILDRHIKTVCSIYNVNENWLRTGEGEMFVQQTEFSLNQYAEKHKLSALEIDIIKSYMEVDPTIRAGILSHFKAIFNSHAETTASAEKTIDEEVAAYRSELEAEKKAAISSASGDLNAKESS